MDSMDTGQYLCVHVSDKDQQSFQVSNLLTLWLHWPFAELGAICNTIFLSLNIHELFEEKKNKIKTQNKTHRLYSRPGCHVCR